MNTPTVVLSANTSWYLYNNRRNTIRAFQDRGYQIVCVSPTDLYSEKLTHSLACRHVPLVMDNQGNNPILDLLLFFRFLGIYRRIRPVATFHFTIKNNIYGTLAAALLGIPAINNVSGLGTAFIHGGWISRVVRGLYRISQPFAFRVFCQNPADLEVLKQYRLVPPYRLFQIPGSGVDLERFQPVARKRSGAPFRFLYL